MFPPNNAPPRPAGPAGAPPAAAAPQGGQQPMQVPPEIAQHIDPNNECQMMLLQRIDKLSPQDLAIANSMSPQIVALLKKVIPEVGFILDMIGQGGGIPDQMPGAAPAPGGAPMPNASAPGGAPPFPPRPAFSQPRPTTKLADF